MGILIVGSRITLREKLTDLDLGGAARNQPQHCTFTMPSRNSLVRKTGRVIEEKGSFFVGFPLQDVQWPELSNLKARIRCRGVILSVGTKSAVPNVARKQDFPLIIQAVWFVSGAKEYFFSLHIREELS